MTVRWCDSCHQEKTQETQKSKTICSVKTTHARGSHPDHGPSSSSGVSIRADRYPPVDRCRAGVGSAACASSGTRRAAASGWCFFAWTIGRAKGARLSSVAVTTSVPREGYESIRPRVKHGAWASSSPRDSVDREARDPPTRVLERAPEKVSSGRGFHSS